MRLAQRDSVGIDRETIMRLSERAAVPAYQWLRRDRALVRRHLNRHLTSLPPGIFLPSGISVRASVRHLSIRKVVGTSTASLPFCRIRY
jgi:hypothetical protein